MQNPRREAQQHSRHHLEAHNGRNAPELLISQQGILFSLHMQNPRREVKQHSRYHLHGRFASKDSPGHQLVHFEEGRQPGGLLQERKTWGAKPGKVQVRRGLHDLCNKEGGCPKYRVQPREQAARAGTPGASLQGAERQARGLHCCQQCIAARRMFARMAMGARRARDTSTPRAKGRHAWSGAHRRSACPRTWTSQTRSPSAAPRKRSLKER